MKTPPYGTRCLVITCFDHRQPQFAGIRRLAAELARRPGLFALDWRGGSLLLGRRRALATLLVSGHGAAGRARLNADGVPLTPDCLRLPPRARLYLAACYQGGPAQRRAWAEAAGLETERVRGHEGETDSALSTCLFLHLLAEGPECLGRRFEEWRRANRYLSPHFPRLRRLYAELGGDPLATLSALGAEVDLAPVADFIAVCRDYPGYLRGLGA